MSEMQGRGYLVGATADFMKNRLGEDEWARFCSSASPAFQQALVEGFEPAAWYPISLLNELIDGIIRELGDGNEEKARQALFDCGQFAAATASNSFLKMLLKILTPSLFAKKAPTMFRRDFSQGRLDVELGDNSISGRMYDMEELRHVGAFCPGFLAFPLTSMGKKISNVELTDWSLDTPYVDGVGFKISWAA